MKFISLVASGAGQDRAQLNEWMLHEFAPQIARNGSRCAVNVLYPAESAASVDLVLETWGDAPGLITLVHASALLQRANVVSYRVTELVEKDELRTSGVPTPAVKLIAAWQARTDIASTEARRHWDEHVPLANRIHIGCVRYVRNWVDALAMSSSAYPRPYQGIAFQYFRTREDLQQRSFDAPESVQVIQNDVAQFIASFDVLIASEYVFEPRGGTGS